MKNRKATEKEKLEIGEFLYFKRLITETYPSGFVSIVSDTWDFWKVMTEFLPRLKDEILARDGRLVIRPDSGEPVYIIAGHKHSDFESLEEELTCPYHEYAGAYELLWKIFGGTINEKGYKVLNPKVGLIYGDSITLERQKEIYKRLEEKGFAATNLVLGVGSCVTGLVVVGSCVVGIALAFTFTVTSFL